MVDHTNNCWTQFWKVPTKAVWNPVYWSISIRKNLIIPFHSDVEAVKYDLFTLPAQKWHWKARLSALYFSQNIPTNHRYEILFTTSVLNLAELIGTRSDLAKCQKIVYFHENQLIYPVRETRDRDCQYGLNEIMTWFVNFTYLNVVEALAFNHLYFF